MKVEWFIWVYQLYFLQCHFIHALSIVQKCFRVS